MTLLDTAESHLSAQPLRVVDAISLGQQPMFTATIQPIVDASLTPTLDEPSSLSLIVIGVFTLVAYRGIFKQTAGQSAAKSTPLVNPRRRAA